jgi:hypothetical protein
MLRIRIPSDSSPEECAAALRYLRKCSHGEGELWLGGELLARAAVQGETAFIRIIPVLRWRVEDSWGLSWDVTTNIPEMERF